MNNSSGFRTIEFIEKTCDYKNVFGYTCNEGLVLSDIECPKCKGAGKIEVTESKLE